MRYSAFNLVAQALRGHRHWQPAWRDAAPKPSYDIVIVGGGGHGLATGYYLAKEHGFSNIAVIEKGWIGSGNAGRNTTIIRSNYREAGNIPLYELSMKLWEGLEQDLNYNTMVSQRGVIKDRKSTRLNSSHQIISYAVFCLKKKKSKRTTLTPSLNMTIT